MSEPGGCSVDRFDELRDKILPVLRPYVTRIALFGSWVRGENTPNSDIDILVELKPAGERPPLGLEWFGLEEELGHLLGQEVDLVSESGLSPYIRPYVEKEKVILYEEG
jgi:predicted nucleotidyltransferase